MFAIILLSGLLVGGSLSAAEIDHLEAARSCIERGEEAIKSVEVPERIAKVVEQLREINPLLRNFSLMKFAESDRADLRLIETGLVKEEEMDQFADLCFGYVIQVDPSSLGGEQECDLEQFVEDDIAYESFLDEVTRHPEYDRKMGTAKLCVTFYLRALFGRS